MFITQHAADRLDDRLGWHGGSDVALLLERELGTGGTVAYILPGVGFMVADDGSNGDTVVAIAVDGSVETVYFRRSTQDMSPAFFGARKVVTL